MSLYKGLLGYLVFLEVLGRSPRDQRIALQALLTKVHFVCENDGAASTLVIAVGGR